MKKLCWICNSEEATTSEHIFKATDVRAHFGGGAYPAGERLVRIESDGRRRIIQSDDSKHIKYGKSLCASCNNAKSQPWDRAYERFSAQVKARAALALPGTMLSPSEMVPGEEGALYSFFIKSFGCQLYECGRSVPNDLRNYLLGTTDTCNLGMSLAVYVGPPPADDPSLFQVFPLEQVGRTGFQWAVAFNSLTLCYWYNAQPVSEMGAVWPLQSNKFVVGRYGG